MPQPTGGEPQWPPRSPHEALMSTPRGRDRIRRLMDRTSPSPSPTKRKISTTYNQTLSANPGQIMSHAEGNDDEEDEETLRLQLEEIQARLKLKRLQKSKSKQDLSASSDHDVQSIQTNSSSFTRSNSFTSSRAFNSSFESRDGFSSRTDKEGGVQVPVSPVRRMPQPTEQRSPGRVLLGIDKGLKGSDVSLKRAPSLRKPSATPSDSSLKVGGYLQRSHSRAGGTTSSIQSSNATESRPQSFSQRLAGLRSMDVESREKQARIEKARSKTFDIDCREIETLKSTAIDFPDIPRQQTEFTRDQVMSSYGRSNLSTVHRGTSTASLKPTAASQVRTSSTASAVSDTPSTFLKTARSKRQKVEPGNVPETEATSFEPYSSFTLSKRIIPHTRVVRTLTGKRIFTIPDLLKTIKGPAFRLPDVEEDVVILGIVGQKSEPRAHKAGSGLNRQKKFMVLTLTDLNYWVELYLFDDAFEKYWKLIPGTVVAILNPGVLPPIKKDTNRFSLSLNTNDETIIEIGTAHDLGFCESIKSDGKVCGSWINKKKTNFCDYHIEHAVEKAKAQRSEVNTMDFGRGRSGGLGARRHNAVEMKEPDKPKHIKYNHESASQVWLNKSGTSNSVQRSFADPEGFNRRSKDEVTRQRLAEREREKGIMRNLAIHGSGMGAAYMQGPLNPEDVDVEVQRPAQDAVSLGILRGSNKEVHLSPVKRKRNCTGSTSESVGWGKNLSQELGRMRNGENLQPVKKKTRFVTDRGIKIAGRESFGGDAVNESSKVIMDDDDDDLDIVH